MIPVSLDDWDTFILGNVIPHTVAYPELVSRGVSKSRKFKWLVKVGACKDVNPPIKKNHGRGGFPGNQKTPLDTPLPICKTWMDHIMYESVIYSV